MGGKAERIAVERFPVADAEIVAVRWERRTLEIELRTWRAEPARLCFDATVAHAVHGAKVAQRLVRLEPTDRAVAPLLDVLHRDGEWVEHLQLFALEGASTDLVVVVCAMLEPRWEMEPVGF